MRARAHTHPAYPYPLQNPTGGGGEEEGPRDSADTLHRRYTARTRSVISFACGVSLSDMHAYSEHYHTYGELELSVLADMWMEICAPARTHIPHTRTRSRIQP